MKPHECPANDWNLYFNGTFMVHEELGVVRCYPSDDGRTFVVTQSDGTSTHSAPELLIPLWPSARAINCPMYNTAIYVGRRGRREARRAATTGHYTVQWTRGRSLTMDDHIMRLICEPEPYPSLNEAISLLETVSSVAIARDLIIYRDGNDLGLVCRGIEVGTLACNHNGPYEFVPLAPTNPLNKRVQLKLDKGGILCP